MLIIIRVSQEILVKRPAHFVIPAGSQKLKDTLVRFPTDNLQMLTEMFLFIPEAMDQAKPQI